MTALSRVVAVCQGHRCRALLAGQDPDGMTALRRAAQASRHGVLLSTDCPGTCAHGPVVALGTGSAHAGTLRVTTHALLGPVGPEQVRALGEHLKGGGAQLPALAEVRLAGRA